MYHVHGLRIVKMSSHLNLCQWHKIQIVYYWIQPKYVTEVLVFYSLICFKIKHFISILLTYNIVHLNGIQNGISTHAYKHVLIISAHSSSCCILLLHRVKKMQAGDRAFLVWFGISASHGNSFGRGSTVLGRVDFTLLCWKLFWSLAAANSSWHQTGVWPHLANSSWVSHIETKGDTHQQWEDTFYDLFSLLLLQFQKNTP